MTATILFPHLCTNNATTKGNCKATVKNQDTTFSSREKNTFSKHLYLVRSEPSLERLEVLPTELGVSGDLLEELLSDLLGLLVRGLLRLGLLRGEGLGSLGVRVEASHRWGVLERVLLEGRALGPGLRGVHDRLNLIRVDEAREVGVGHHVLREGKLAVPAVHGVQSGEGRLGPDAKPSEVSAWGQVEKVEPLHVGDVHSRQVPHRLGKSLVGAGDDDERSLPARVAPVPHLSLAPPNVLGLRGLGDVGVHADALEQVDGLVGLGDRLRGVGDHERDLGDLVDDVSPGHDQGWDGAGGQSGGDGEPLLLEVHLPVPPPPGLHRAEHMTPAAHVTVGSLSAPVGTSTWHTRDTGHGASSSPRGGGGLSTRVLVHGVSLHMVLSHIGVHHPDDVWPQRRLGEDQRKSNLILARPIEVLHANQRSRTHGRSLRSLVSRLCSASSPPRF
mmetsp:Transcript_1686/g.5741  ORF Transcript_1686/g.5741 Transcript_1686/m.5741 type:complete len:445 (+) Transcript_1686:241-1575(+)